MEITTSLRPATQRFGRRGWMLALAFGMAMVARAAPGADDEKLPAADRAAVQAALKQMASALKDRKVDALAALGDVDAAVDAVGRQKLLAQFDAAARAKLHSAFAAKMMHGLAETAETAGWKDGVVGSIRPGDSNGEAIATVRFRTQEGPQAKLRVWLKKTKNGWRVFDWEDNELPIRMTTIAGMLFPSDDATQQAARLGFPFLVQAAQCAADGDMDKAGTLLKKVDKTAFAPSVDAFRWLLVGLVESAHDRLGDALRSFDRAEKLGGIAPSLIYHRAMVQVKLNDIEAALALTMDYLRHFGEDAEVLALAADALADLNRGDEAIATYRRALAEDPTSVAALAGLAHALPKAARGEVVQRFAKLAEAKELFPDFAEQLVEDADDATLDAVVALQRKATPGDPLVDYYAAQAKVLRAEYDAAANVLKAALPKVKDDELRQAFGDQIIESLLLAKRPLDAYAAAPESRRAFRAVAERLVKDEQADALDKLIQTHAKKSAGDLWLPYFRGQLAALRRQFDEAEKAFVDGLKAPIDDTARESYRSARVAALFRAGKAVEALRDIGPEKKTFDQLAKLASEAEQDVVLKALIDRHAKTMADDADLGLWDAEVEWLRRDYRKAAATLRKHRLLISGRRSSNRQYIDRVVRSLLRSDQRELALEEARVFEIRERDPLYRAVALSGDGAVEPLFEAIKACLKHGYSLDDLRDDPDIGRAMRAPKLRGLLQDLEAPARP